MDNIKFFEMNGVEMVTVKETEDMYRTMTKEFYLQEYAKQNTENSLAQAEHFTPILPE